MQTSNLSVENEIIYWKNTKSRIFCFMGSILVVLLIWLICTYFNFITSSATHFFNTFLGVYQAYCEKFDRLSSHVHYIITSIAGVIFLYCFCSLFSDRKMFFLEKIAFIVSAISLLIALFYKFNDDGCGIYTVFNGVAAVIGGCTLFTVIALLMISLASYIDDN